MNPSVDNFVSNLRSGARLAFFCRCKLSDFRFSFDQLALLLIFDFLLEIVADYAQALPLPEFSQYALPTYTFELACFFITVYIIGKLLRRDFAALQISVIVYSFAPLLIVLQQALTYSESRSQSGNMWLDHVFSVYEIAVLFRALYLVSGRAKLLTVPALVLMALALSITPALFGEYRDFWYAGETSDESEKADIYAEYRALDAETLMYRQPAILDKALAKLRPQRKKRIDLFFVGFAAYATEDVFSKEVAYAKQLLDERFDTKGHSISLINHLDTRDKTPLATASNLAVTLKRIGKLMNTEEDVLLLYLTSHGSKNHQLSVSFWPLALNDITPEKLRSMLDEAGIKWRMIVISACYSGGFVKALQGSTTLVATAAAADKTSFGCGTESEFTYFGEAVFKDQLNRHSSFITALQEAEASIRQREVREKLEASMPQLSIGKAIEPKLKRLDNDMHQHQCGIARMKVPSC
jgi:hypothetical protein